MTADDLCTIAIRLCYTLAASMFFANRAVNRLAIHTALQQLAWCMSGAFFGVYLLRAGLAPSVLFLASAGVLLLRFMMRPLVLLIAPRIGLRTTLVIGTLLTALQYPAVGLVHGADATLILFCLIGALAGVFYWPCYHTFFAALGDREYRGSQVGVRQVLMGVAAVAGPAAGGVMLARFGPWVAFGTAAAVQVFAALPLFAVREPLLARRPPRGAYAASWSGVRLFAADGWMLAGASLAWDITMFRALQSRFDQFGGVLALAALAGALGSVVLGRFIDLGHARRVIAFNAAMLCTGVLLRTFVTLTPAAVISVALVTTALGGMYVPVLMTAFYNASKVSPCPFRFQFAAEGGWDFGGAGVSLIAAMLCATGVAPQTTIFLALPAVLAQAWLLARVYRLRPATRPARFEAAPSTPLP
ncbi:MAG TPA: MFS transporter [Stellaceae bacterium]|nr:MFS transporter [Stellaceae bacterium]